MVDGFVPVQHGGHQGRVFFETVPEQGQEVGNDQQENDQLAPILVPSRGP